MGGAGGQNVSPGASPGLSLWARFWERLKSPCVLPLHLLHSRAADNMCRHTGPLRKCLRTKAHLAEFPLGPPLYTEASRVHRFGARQEGFAPRLHPLRARAPDVPGRSLPDALATVISDNILA